MDTFLSKIKLFPRVFVSSDAGKNKLSLILTVDDRVAGMLSSYLGFVVLKLAFATD